MKDNEKERTSIPITSR